MRSRIPPGSVALVTGSSSGIGLRCCVELARLGLRVVASVRDASCSPKLDAAMAEAGLRCDKIELDVTREGSIAAAMAHIEAEHGGVDVLVNNAGFAMAGCVEDLGMDELREQLETNFFGLVAVTKAVIPGMRARRRGRIINLSSLGGRVANPGMAAYSASKFAVEGLSESLRYELSSYGVYVVLIEPGVFRTDVLSRHRRVARAAFDPNSPNFTAFKHFSELIDGYVIPRAADPRMVASVIASVVLSERPRLRYLVGADARAVTMASKLLPFRLWERAVGRIAGFGSASGG